ncbi:hypothetical protein SynSYN20_01641 [Synechococcus sp. SYN20]|nr:hypothetical protein SynSYN20_01641 [Synechococcus sp. SYN20]
MPASRVGPLFGPLPELDESWILMTADETLVLYTAEDVREFIREIQDLRGAYDQIHKLSMAMNGLAAYNPVAVKTVLVDVIRYLELEDILNAKQEESPTNVSPDGLPIIKADVVEYSEEPLKNGTNYMETVLQPMRERMARLKMSICRALDLCSYDLSEAPCCDGPTAMKSYRRGATHMYRS